MSFGPSLRPKVKGAAEPSLAVHPGEDPGENEDGVGPPAIPFPAAKISRENEPAPSFLMSLSSSRQPVPSSPTQRVVVLVDLDCFYAQCECVRLGYDALETPLVLMQWNSALAVTYPARALGIERGESWQSVHDKSGGACLAVHVPVIRAAAAAIGSSSSASASFLATATGADEAEGMDGSDGKITPCDGDDTANETGGTGNVVDLDGAGMRDYDAMFRLSSEEQEAARRRDVGTRHLSDRGKACIERYRIASARILNTVSSFLASQAKGVCGTAGGGGIQVERASIDEFYMDVTEACAAAARASRDGASRPPDWEQAIRETNVIGWESSNEESTSAAEATSEALTHSSDKDSSQFALQYGCWLAWKLRQEVRTKLGFTLSAGVAANKMLAKLSASYGKPNGQAVLYPDHVGWLLNKTPIRKCRNLGGKLGSRVRKLLPPNVPETVGSIAKYVSYQMLTSGGDGGAGLGPDSARWLLDYVRGVDMEAVQQETIVKTITSSKTLNKSPPLPECATWFELLVKEVVTRVERDAQTHHRYPLSYHVHYLVYNPNTTKRVWQQSSRGWKTCFPRSTLSTANKVNDILSKILPAIAAKEKNPNVRLQLIGLGAVDFIDRPTGGVRDFFAAKSNEAVKASSEDDARHVGDLESKAEGLEETAGESDEAMARRLQNAYDDQNGALPSTRRDVPLVSVPSVANKDDSQTGAGCVADRRSDDPDLVLARRLQAEYDRENRMVQALERRDKVSAPRSSKARKIDSFFKSTLK